MKKNFKRTLAIFLTAVMLLCMAPISGFAGLELPSLGELFGVNAEAGGLSGTYGNNLTWSLDTDTGVLTISGTSEMNNYSSYTSVPWYTYRTDIKTVVLPDGITSIGNYAFYNCSSLTSITIPDSVTSIGSYAFRGCTSLTSVTIPDSVTSIGGYAFGNCTSLTSVTILDSVTSIGDSAFRGCTSLASITIPDSVTIIGSDAFYYCTSLTSITIPDSVTSICDATFGECSSLTSITIPDSVTSIGYEAFYNCTSLTSVTIPDSVTSIDYSAFYGCTSLASITIPDSVTSIGGYAFCNCSSLEYVHITKGVSSIGGTILYNTSAYICSDTEDCYAKTYAEENGIEFRVCNGHDSDTHEHDYATFSHYQTAHPHYAVYKCSCGAEKVTSETSKVESCTVCYPVAEKTVVSLTVTAQPSVNRYKYGIENLDTSGLEIVATYSDGSTAVIDNSEVEFTGFDTSTRGIKTITATYEGCTATFDIEVYYTFWQWLLYIFCFGWIWM